MSFQDDVNTVMRSQSSIFVYAGAGLVLLIGLALLAFFYWYWAVITLLVLSGGLTVWLLCRFVYKLVTESGGR